MRLPEADLLRDSIYELRVGLQGINYRILYFFHGQTAAVLAHGLVKERVVPSREIDVALARKRRFEQETERHTYQET
ncbi:MAG: type II toxin-antitoxin system RelE/ParE family toxin [Nitrospira sp.]|nr:type II toxin-antitoxin system RelE/ParE family toxin [Nitrospira sp.]